MNGFLGHLCAHRLNWTRRTSWGWRDEWYDIALQQSRHKIQNLSPGGSAGFASRHNISHWPRAHHIRGPTETFFHVCLPHNMLSFSHYKLIRGIFWGAYSVSWMQHAIAEQVAGGPLCCAILSLATWWDEWITGCVLLCYGDQCRQF